MPTPRPFLASDLLPSPLDDYFDEEIDISSVEGNVSPELKRHVAVLFRLFRSRKGNGFADSVGGAVRIKSIDVENFGEKKRQRSTVICECMVTEGGKSIRVPCLRLVIEY
jgi:hypothetical protein